MNRISKHLRSNVVGYVAVFIALSGTAYALDGPLAGQNTVGSVDVIDDEIHSRDVRDDSLTNGGLRNVDLRAGSVGTSEVANGSLTPADLAGVQLLESHTATLNDQPGGSSSSEALFTIGRVDLLGFCQDQGGGSLVAGINPIVQESGAVLVVDGNGTAADDSVPLQQFDVQFVAIVNSSAGIKASEASFAILDETEDSASGVAAVSVDPATGDCVITAHAVG